MAANNDSADLEALFDSIASDFTPVAAPAPAPVTSPSPTAGADSDDLQALFDSIAAETVAVQAPAATPAVQVQEGGTMEGCRRQLAKAGSGFQPYWPYGQNPARYAWPAGLRQAGRTNGHRPAGCQGQAGLCGQSDRAGRLSRAQRHRYRRPLVDDIENAATALGERWDKAFANQLGVAEFKQLAEETRAYLKDQVPAKTRATHAQLTEIMMAQDFQDLTGQVIKKVVALAQDLEAGLMGALLDVLPETRRTEEVASLMNGPVVNAEGRTDVVVNQEQVDDLLDSLGF